jgi:hypothetical protein
MTLAGVQTATLLLIWSPKRIEVIALIAVLFFVLGVKKNITLVENARLLRILNLPMRIL